MNLNKPAWISAISLAVIALCAVVLTVDLILIQVRLGQAMNELSTGLGGLLGGGEAGEPDGAPDCTDPLAENC